jgi:hypothetical protein
MARYAAPSASDSADDCPNPESPRVSTQMRALHLACLILGGLAQLAEHIRASEAALQTWIDGVEDPPESVFLAAVEVILLDTEKRAGLAN